MEDYSQQIKAFLEFLKDCEEANQTAASVEADMDLRTQDILHNMELRQNSQYDYICQGIALKNIRRRRREAKDTREITDLICDWSASRKGTIKELEQLLGKVRRAEKKTSNRYYINKTDVMKGLLE